MTKGLTMNFGGVKLQKSEVASTKTKTVKDYYGKAVKLFMVDFKNGVKIAYKQSTNNASIFSGKNNTWNSTNTNINFVEGLELKGTNNRDDITVRGGSINGIDVSKDGGGDTVKVTLADSDKSGVSSGNVSPNILGGGTIWTDKQDETQIRNYGDKNYSHKGSSLNGVYRNDL